MSDEAEQRDDVPSSSMALSRPIDGPRTLQHGGIPTNVAIEHVPGGVAIRVRSSWTTRMVWIVGTGFFLVPTLGLGLGALGGLLALLWGKIVLGTALSLGCGAGAAILGVVTYRAAAIALNTTTITADDTHLLVSRRPLPRLPIDVENDRVRRLDVEWQGGGGRSGGPFWAVILKLDDDQSMPLAQNLSSFEDAQAVRVALSGTLRLDEHGIRQPSTG